MGQLSPEMRRCVDECLRCYSACLSMAAGHCLEAGGKHVEPRHFRLMLACAEICRECAKDCAGLEGMETCAEACRRCVESCAALAA